MSRIRYPRRRSTFVPRTADPVAVIGYPLLLAAVILAIIIVELFQALL